MVRASQKTSTPPGREIDAALGRVRAALANTGVLLLHDAALPSATAAASEEVVKGSWWAHPKSALIFAALNALGDEVVWPKLVVGKVTLVERPLFPALASVALSGEDWQTRGLSRVAAEILARVDRPASTSELGLPTGRTTSAAVTELERRLLVYAEERHTEAGRHERVLTPWKAWCQARDLALGRLPTPSEARSAFERAIAGWAGATLPWR